VKIIARTQNPALSSQDEFTQMLSCEVSTRPTGIQLSLHLVGWLASNWASTRSADRHSTESPLGWLAFNWVKMWAVFLQSALSSFVTWLFFVVVAFSFVDISQWLIEKADGCFIPVKRLSLKWGILCLA